MTERTPFKDVEPLEIKDVDVYAFRCGTCGSRAVPVEGYGQNCHKPDCDGEFTERTAETFTVTLSTDQLAQYADSVIVD